MDVKTLRGVEIKDADKGIVQAVFSTFDMIDHDGDVTLPGAITDGAPVRISSYNHTSWGGALPVGKGVVRVRDNTAVLEGQFFMGTTHGRDTFETVKQMGALQEWSYGFDIEDAEPGERDGQRVRLLRRLKVHEVSPVLLGAGIGTRTLATKSRTGEGRVPAVKGSVPAHETAVATTSWDAAATERRLPEDARPSHLRTVYAWVDPDGDPEAKSSYGFPHHHGIDGPANLRACLSWIAVLNGARDGTDLSDADRKAVYDHLAAHVRDADREPPELRDRSAGPTKNQTLNEELVEALAYTSGVIESASRVVALRAEKGKTLSRGNTELLDWIGDDLKQLQALLTTPPAGTVSDEELASTFLAGLARLHEGVTR
ncbi:HK97 family phage prohead protease [Nocardiopsis sp. NPDC049922]|uniref:HK97 family phage prohead protease n=1 Tax=Nocardiopsis sp. NPDC049922 TaxID=3155157 RepID=UPI0033CB8AA7